MNKLAFTLIEILIVIVVIGIISSFIIVSMSSITAKANITKGQAFTNSFDNGLLLSRISQWKFDESSGVTAYDSWNTNNGTLSGATTPQIQTSGCLSGNCLLFNDSTSYITVANVNNLKFSTGTISIWFKWPSSYGIGALYAFTDKDVAGGKWSAIGIGDWTGGYSDESIQFYYYGTPTNIEFYYRNGHYFYRDNNWHNVVMTVGTDYNAMYVDGQKLTNLTYNTGNASIGGVFSNDAAYDTFEIGSRLLSTGRDVYFGGYLDDIRIYNAAIPNSRIEQNYYSGLNRLFNSGGIGLEDYQQRILANK